MTWQNFKYSRFALMAAFALAGCDFFQIENDKSFDVVFNVKSAGAIDCDSTCGGILFSIEILNNSDFPVCFSSRYIGHRISNSVFITSLTDNELYYYQISGYSDDGYAYDTPENSGYHVEMLRNEPNIYVGAHSKIEFEVGTGVKYAIPNAPLEAKTSMYLYPCDEVHFAQFHHTRLISGKTLNFGSFNAKMPNTTNGLAPSNDGLKAR